MSLSTLSALTAAVLFLAGCMPQQMTKAPVPISTPFDPASHSLWRAEGTGIISGQAFLRQQGGGVVTCAGREVLLFPKSPYFDEMVRILKSRNKPDPGTTSVKQYARQATCDAQGKFTFRELPAARWYVTTEVSWVIGYANQGGGVIKEVDSAEGKTVEVFLTDADTVGW